MSNSREKPFEFLRRNNGERFADEVVRNWYIARTYVRGVLNELEKKNPFAPGSDKHLHVVLMGDSPRMLHVARQVALSAHYVNFNDDEVSSCNRTIITFVTKSKDIKERLSAEEYLCNLPKHCRLFVYGEMPRNESSFIDIEIRIAPECPKGDDNEVMYTFDQSAVDAFFDKIQDGDEEVLSIDTRKAFYANSIYQIGETIDNLPAENIHDTKRYVMALNVFQYEKLSRAPQPLFANIGDDVTQYWLKETLSNVFCSDIFWSRANAINKLKRKDSDDGTQLWQRFNEALSKSEHARWVVEKLIMGYRPFNNEERYRDEALHVQFRNKDKIKRYRDSLKKNDHILAHIDLCSYRDLRRINPVSLKYDSFLMLAIPRILKVVNESEEQNRR